VKPNVLFLIIASNNPENVRDLQAQLSTWLGEIPSNYQFLIIRGSELSRFNYSLNTLYVPARELYENILLKTSLGICWAIENMDFDLLIRTNVSTYFAIDQLDKIIDKISQKDILRLGKIKHFTVDFKREGNFIGLILDLLDTFYQNEPSFNLLFLVISIMILYI
jgi:hypothetical protein